MDESPRYLNDALTIILDILEWMNWSTLEPMDAQHLKPTDMLTRQDFTNNLRLHAVALHDIRSSWSASTYFLSVIFLLDSGH